jgi:hypothetical protein
MTEHNGLTRMADIDAAFKNLMMRGNRHTLMEITSRHMSVDHKELVVLEYEKKTGERFMVEKRRRI